MSVFTLVLMMPETNLTNKHLRIPSFMYCFFIGVMSDRNLTIHTVHFQALCECEGDCFSINKQLMGKSRDLDGRTKRGTESTLWEGWWLRGMRSKAGEILEDIESELLCRAFEKLKM